MSRLLLINPNTSTSVTELLAAHVERALEQQQGQGLRRAASPRLLAVTARFGAAYIADEASYAQAEHATLDAWQAVGQPVQAILIGCFGDPGLLALRAQAGVPVTGLAEAAFLEAAAIARRSRPARRFAVVTGGERWGPMLMALAASLGYADLLAGVQTVPATGAELAANPQAAQHLLQQACQQALARWQPAALIIGGAGLAGWAARLQPACPIPLIDSVTAGALRAHVLMQP